MIVGIGTDLVAIDRVGDFLRRQPRLPERLLGPAERSRYEALPAGRRARFLALAIAAKEAAVKALATGIGKGVGWHDFATARDGAGMPLLAAKGAAAELAQSRGIDCWHLSLSDDQGCALAFVIAESRSPSPDRRAQIAEPRSPSPGRRAQIAEPRSPSPDRRTQID